jgi:hypothetical protein
MGDVLTSVRAGQQHCTFTVHARDVHGNDRTVGGDTFTFR